MEKKATRDELIIEVDRLKNTARSYVDRDEERRREFAKSFQWFKRKETYDYDNSNSPTNPSWEDIFVKVGMLLANQEFSDNRTQLGQMDYSIKDIYGKVELIMKKLGITLDHDNNNK